MSNRTWRKSSFSTTNNDCIELATTGDAVRDSKHPGDGHVVCAVTELAALVGACREGRLDHLAG